MFEQSVLEARTLTARPWSLAVSLAGQMFLITAAVLLPLVHPEVLQRAAFWIPVTGPPPAYHPPAPAKLDVVRATTPRRDFTSAVLTSPIAIPQKVAMIQDPPPDVGGGVVGADMGVPGGFGPPGAISAAMKDIIKVQTPAAPPKPVEAVAKPQPPPPAPKEPLRVGGDVQAAKLISAPSPVYPPLARQARVQGVVHLSALIGPDGRIAGLRATDGHPLLVGAAMDAVKRWVYHPTLLNGIPVEVVTEVTVTFTLN
jgi:protein TonB